MAVERGIEVALDDLRQRRSAKWRAFDPDVLPVWVAEMDFTLAPAITEALRQAVERSDTGYMHVGELPTALAQYAQRTWSWSVDPELVMVLPDVLAGVAAAIEAFTQPGDGIVINTPVYPPFFSTIEKVTGRRVVDVPMARDASGAYTLDLEAIADAAAAGGVTAILLCSPHNPTGTVPSRAELERIGEIAQRHGVVVIADEIHAPLTMPGVVHTPWLSVAPADLPSVSVISASKAWNLAGLKCAQLVAGSPAVMERLLEATPSETLYGTGLLGVLGSIAAYRDGSAWLEQVRGVVAANAQTLGRAIAERMPEVGYVPPAATYLAWLDCRGTAVADDPAAALLDRGRVAVNDGRMFGPNGIGFVRVNLATSPAILDEAIDRIASVLA